jgi:hypothetical protein
VTYSSRQRRTRWVRWTDNTGYRWHVGLTWARPEGQTSRLVGFELWATPPGSDRTDLGPEEDPADELHAILGERPTIAAITSRLLHDLPLKRVVAPAKAEILDLLRSLPVAPGGDIRTLVQSRQPRYPYGHYEAVAGLYRGAVTKGLDPLGEIRSAHPWASRRAVAAWVYRCRHDLGLIGPARSPGLSPGSRSSGTGSP